MLVVQFWFVVFATAAASTWTNKAKTAPPRSQSKRTAIFAMNPVAALAYMITSLLRAVLHLSGAFFVDGLGIEHRDGEVIGVEVFARDLAHLLGSHGTNAVDVLVYQTPAETQRLQ